MILCRTLVHWTNSLERFHYRNETKKTGKVKKSIQIQKQKMANQYCNLTTTVYAFYLGWLVNIKTMKELYSYFEKKGQLKGTVAPDWIGLKVA